MGPIKQFFHKKKTKKMKFRKKRGSFRKGKSRRSGGKNRRKGKNIKSYGVARGGIRL